MIVNHLKIALRSLRKSKSYALLNLLGLTSGLVVFILITLYTSHEFSYDQYHKKVDRIYRVYKQDMDNFYQGTNKFAVVPTPLAPTMQRDFPEVEAFTHLKSEGNVIMKVGEEVFLEPSIHMADPAVFDLFTLDLLVGDKSEALQGPDAMVISESVAMKYFGKLDVIGEVIRYRDEFPFKVTGVIRDMPVNSHFIMDVILNFDGVVIPRDGRQRTESWSNSSYHSFVLLTPGADARALQERLPTLREKYADDPIDEDGQESNYYLQPMADVHFTSGVNFDLAPNADRQALYIYVGIAFLILVIAAINYINLATARAINKTKETGIRKVIGAQRSSLIFQFLVESGLLVFVALLLAVGVLWLAMPPFATFIDKPLVFDFSSVQLWVLLVSLGISMTLLSGFYPALVLARFRPIAALKGNTGIGKGKAVFRNALVVFQFAISCALILGATVLTEQLNFIQNMDTGFTRNQIIVIGMRDKGVRDQLDVFKEELARIPGVKTVASSNALPNNFSSNTNANWVGRPEGARVVLYTNTADYNFADLFELEMKEGRNFDPDIPTDETAVLLNESAVKALGWEEPIGKQIIRWWGDTGRVVGVLKDFHVHSVHLSIEPVQIFQRSGQFHVSVKLEGGNIDDTLKAIEAKYQSFNPVYPFEYNFFDEIFDRAYLSETRTAQLTNWFTGLAILIACLGLYGLAAHKVQHRIKEVGVRKVLGASVPDLLRLLSKDFAILLLLAFLVAAPLAYFVMDSWLDNFAYHIDISVTTFFIALLLMVCVAGLTVGYRTYSAAVKNPVEALRDE
jgi:putative ABC transport system permease protein